MIVMALQITCVLIVYSTVCSGIDQRKHQSSASLAFVRRIHQWLNSPHKGPVTQKMFPFDDVIMLEIDFHLNSNLQWITSCYFLIAHIKFQNLFPNCILCGEYFPLPMKWQPYDLQNVCQKLKFDLGLGVNGCMKTLGSHWFWCHHSPWALGCFTNNAHAGYAFLEQTPLDMRKWNIASTR